MEERRERQKARDELFRLHYENFVDTSLLFKPNGKGSQVYITNDIVKNILKSNVIDDNRNTNLNVFYAGSKVIEKETKTKSKVNLKGNLSKYYLFPLHYLVICTN